MSLAASGIVTSIVPFDPTYGITIVASVMLAVIVCAMVFFALAPLVSDSWAEQLSATSTSSATPSAEPSDD
ncbi:hypothetical protein [Natronorubrum texcoconense]|uniref:Uncharacterized protein n=1 Tax=Natronorubrum texcoconense TaxID=1095776 RepID=A0A1G8YH82_9EURY|nr:hypothetical protein [Natronorubrum texcoconense]SDK02053.1 hypothetical protein SAMN04515672_2160 [Natronorubrum texcoconense]